MGQPPHWPRIRRESSRLKVGSTAERIDGHGEVCSWWQGPSETALYLYGASFDTMAERIADLLATYPLCQGARVIKVA